MSTGAIIQTDGSFKKVESWDHLHQGGEFRTGSYGALRIDPETGNSIWAIHGKLKEPAHSYETEGAALVAALEMLIRDGWGGDVTWRTDSMSFLLRLKGRKARKEIRRGKGTAQGYLYQVMRSLKVLNMGRVRMEHIPAHPERRLPKEEWSPSDWGSFAADWLAAGPGPPWSGPFELTPNWDYHFGVKDWTGLIWTDRKGRMSAIMDDECKVIRSIYNQKRWSTYLKTRRKLWVPHQEKYIL